MWERGAEEIKAQVSAVGFWVGEVVGVLVVGLGDG